MFKKLILISSVISLSLGSSMVNAKVAEAEANKLGSELTPLGGIQAGNADGSIPAWTGGITTPPAGYKPGDFHPDPFKDDKVLFEITAQNYKQYAEFLSDGQQKMFETYPDTFKMPVYPTQRSASSPQFVYDETKKNALMAELIQGGNGVKNAAIGIPFPIPQSGIEAIWNHILRYRGETVRRFGGQAAPTASGDFNVIGFDDLLLQKYSAKDATREKLLEENVISKFMQEV
ncbi:MAG: DUF1329 domain-containing protein, partial [Paraglaciecola sp.]|nr:DUF1329 domain-containing protein [Paraglaciecola sp.]